MSCPCGYNEGSSVCTREAVMKRVTQCLHTSTAPDESSVEQARVFTFLQIAERWWEAISSWTHSFFWGTSSWLPFVGHSAVSLQTTLCRENCWFSNKSLNKQLPRIKHDQGCLWSWRFPCSLILPFVTGNFSQAQCLSRIISLFETAPISQSPLAIAALAPCILQHTPRFPLYVTNRPRATGQTDGRCIQQAKKSVFQSPCALSYCRSDFPAALNVLLCTRGCFEEPSRFKVLQCCLLFQEELVVLALLKVQWYPQPTHGHVAKQAFAPCPAARCGGRWILASVWANKHLFVEAGELVPSALLLPSALTVSTGSLISSPSLSHFPSGSGALHVFCIFSLSIYCLAGRSSMQTESALASRS